MGVTDRMTIRQKPLPRNNIDLVVQKWKSKSRISTREGRIGHANRPGDSAHSASAEIPLADPLNSQALQSSSAD
jgi:hypothetical protein